MPFVQDNKNVATAPLGSIKDRIKNFEFMKKSGTTSPRARSPAPSFTNNESSRTLRRTGTSWERDGGERRQMRRSERREAELRRENEFSALKAEVKPTPRNEENPTTEKTVALPQATERQVPRAAPRVTPRVTPHVTPRVAPREEDNPPEPVLRRRRNESKETWNSVEKNTHGPSHVQNSVSPETLSSRRTTESSSNETIDINSSEETADISSEEVEESKTKENKSEEGQEEDENEQENEQEDGEEDKEEEDEEVEDEEEEEEEEEDEEEEEEEEQENETIEKTSEVEEEEDEEQQDDDDDDNELEVEEDKTETEEDKTETEEDKTETEEESDDDGTEEEQEEGSEDEEEDESDTEFEPPKQQHTTSVKEETKLRRNKIANYTNTRKTSRQDQRHGDGGENDNVVSRQDSRHKKDKRTNETEILSERHTSSHEKKARQHQRQSSISGNESGDVKSSRHRKDKGPIQQENMPQSPNEVKTKQLRRHGSATGSDLGKVQEEKLPKTSDISAEKSDSVSEKTKKDEQRHTGLVRTKSMTKGSRRSGSRNSSLKSIPAADLEESSKHQIEKQAVSKSKQAAKKEDGGSATSSRRNSRKTSWVEDEPFQHSGNENEAISSSSQLNLYSNNVLGLVPAGMQTPVDVESEGTSSPDLKHDEHPSKKAFVCAIHEEPCKYYCQDCERLICSECAMRWGDCHEHYYLRVKDAWKKYREEMMKILQEARSSVSCIQEDILENSKERDSFKLKVESTIKKINSFFDEHVQALEKRRTNFLETVEEIMKFREIGINQEIESLQNNLVETNSTINVAGRVYGTSTMMEFLQVCKQLTNRLLELGHKKVKLNITESIDIDFISDPNLFEEIEKVGQLKKHQDSPATNSHPHGNDFDDRNVNGVKVAEQQMSKNEAGMRSRVEDAGKVEENEQDSMDSVVGTSTENLSESTSAKDTNDIPRKHTLKNAEESLPQTGFTKLPTKVNDQEIMNQGKHGINHEAEVPVKMKSNDKLDTTTKFAQHSGPGATPEEPMIKQATDDHNLRSAPGSSIDTTDHPIADCSCNHEDGVDNQDGLASDAERDPKAGIPVKKKPQEQQHARRHSMDDVLGARSKKAEIQRRLGSIGRYRPPKSVAQFLDDGERYFSSGEAEQRRRKQEYYKVRFNDRAYYSNPSDSSELEEMRGYDLEERPVKHKVRRHRTMPLIRPISERRELKSPWTLDVFRFHGKIHFSRNSLKATGKAFGWNAVVGCQGFSQGKHTWKVRVTKWTAVGVCYKDDHVDNPSWGAGHKWTWDSADMCYSPRLGVCESPVGEWIDGDVIALELDCDNSVLIVHNLRTAETDKLYGFKEPVYPYFYLSVFRSISVIEIDGMQVGS